MLPTQITRSRECWRVAGVLVVVVGLCWAWIVPMSLDMAGRMAGAAAWMMTGTWDAPHMLLLFAMWVVMMTGMMLPSAAPAALQVVRGRRPDAADGSAVRDALAFAGGYVAVWAGFSLLATVAQRVLDHAQILSPMMEIQDARWSTVFLVVAGVYQFTPFKRARLQSCRCASGMLSGAGFRRGVRNGVNGLGCCWALMLLLFVGGVMNLWWNLGLTLFVFLEKIVRPGWPRACVISLPVIAAGLWLAARKFG